MICWEAQGEGQEHSWVLQGTGKGDVLGVRAEGSSLGEPGQGPAPSGPAPPRAGLASGGKPWAWFGAL